MYVTKKELESVCHLEANFGHLPSDTKWDASFKPSNYFHLEILKGCNKHAKAIDKNIFKCREF